jgi:hypothetical protein
MLVAQTQTQTKPYPRSMYHRDHDKPKVVNSRAEEVEASTKGWITSYIFKEYPKWVDGKLVQSRADEDRILMAKKALTRLMEPDEIIENLFEDVPTKDQGWAAKVKKEIQVDGQDTATFEKPKKSPGRPKKE